jgi:hypothetical protein
MASGPPPLAAQPRRPAIRRTLAVEGLLASGDMGRCPYSVLALRDLLREVFAALIDNPRATPPRSEDTVEARLVSA